MVQLRGEQRTHAGHAAHDLGLGLRGHKLLEPGVEVGYAPSGPEHLRGHLRGERGRRFGGRQLASLALGRLDYRFSQRLGAPDAAGTEPPSEARDT